MMKHIGKKTIVVMPVANEGETIASELDYILSLYDDIFIYPVMDKFSKDNTEKIVDEYQYDTYERVKKIYHRDSTGVASCYLYGFKRALDDGAAYIIEMDGGLSHNPAELPLFIDKLNEGYDCVFSTRFSEGGSEEDVPFKRRMLSKGGTMLSNIVLGTRLHDMTSGYEAFTADVLKSLNLDKFLSRGHMFQTEMRYYCRNFNNAVVPITYKSSSSSLKSGTVKKALMTLFRLKENEAVVKSI